MATNLEKFMRGIRAVESSGGDYKAIGPNNPGLGTGKGAYQYLDSTWNNYRGYSRADAAPKSVQDARARLDFTRFFKRYGRWGLVAIAHHAGEGTADKVKKDPSALNGVGDLNLSTKQYVAKVLGAAGLKRNSAGPGERGGGGDGGGRRGGGGLRRKPWALPRNVVGKGGRLTVDVNELYQLARGLTGHLAVLESVRRRAASVAEDLDRLALDDRGDARRIRRELDTALSDEYGVGRARNLLVRDIGYVVEARERALGADRTDRDHRRVVERLIASLGAESTTVATRRKIRRLLRGLYTERSSGGGGGSGSPTVRNGKLVKPLKSKLTSSSEFNVPDAEGAPSNNGQSYHAGKDWFAPAGTAVMSPISGKVVEVKPSVGNSGQVFGGVVKVQGSNGRVWVFRHIDPAKIKVGQRVDAGDRIAKITNWTGGGDHAHIEHWKTLSGGYDFENMLDPMKSLRRFL